MAKEETMKAPQQGQSYDEVLNNMSVDQLKNAIINLDRQCGSFAKSNQNLQNQLETLQKSEFYLILEWNYRIATEKDGVFPDDFKKECVDRIVDMMTPQKNNENNGEQQ